MLTKIHLKLQKLKSSPLQPFGGLNIIFSRVFMQFPPISDTPLYTFNIIPPLTFTKQTQKEKTIGKSLWENYVMPNCDKVKTFNMFNCSIMDKKIKLLKMIFHYSNFVFYQNYKINLLEHLWNKATYVAPKNE
jgi:hypothetical protein